MDLAPESSRAVWKRFPEFRPEPALIFAADSRWYYPQFRISHDGGIKVAAIDRFGGATYAGNTDAGEVANHWLTENFRRIRAGLEANDLRDELKLAWKEFGRGPNDVLQLAFGFFLESGEPVLFRLDSWNGFLPLEVVGTTDLGWPSAITKYRASLAERVADHFAPKDGRVISQGADHWALLMQTLVRRLAEDPNEPYVGGKTSGLVVRRSGLSGVAGYEADPSTGLRNGYHSTQKISARSTSILGDYRDDWATTGSGDI